MTTPDTHASHTELEHVDLTGPGPHTATPDRANLPHSSPGLPTGAKAEIMARLHTALGDGEPPVRVDVDRGYRHGRAEGTDLVALFAERMAERGAVVVRANAFTMVPTAAGLLHRAGVRRLVAPPGRRIAWLAATGIEFLRDEPPLTDRQLQRVDGVVTGCALAIAETGTIVLDGGPDQGRRVLSLLPDHHLCVVRSEQIVGTVPEAVARLDPTRPQTWISGPAATGGSATDRTHEDSHGSPTLHVLLLG